MFHARAPSPALAPFVATLWYYEDAALAAGRELVVPNGAPQLLVNLDEDVLECWDGPGFREHVRRSGAALVGPRSSAAVLDPGGQRHITGVALLPGAAPLFTGLEAAETAGEMIELEVFAPRSRLRDRMLEAEGAEAVLALWERFLVGRLRGERDRAVERAVAALEAGARVGAVALELGWSMPRLRAHFAARVGLTPKRWARVRRVQRVLGALEREQRPAWAELALDHGYADQAHLVREFREITGVTPGAYRARRPGEANHIALE